MTQISKIVIEEGQGPCMYFGYDIFSLDSKHINVWCYWLSRPAIAGHSPNMSEHRSSILESEHRDWSTHFAPIESRSSLRDRYEQVMANIWWIIRNELCLINVALMYNKAFLLFWNSIFRVTKFSFNSRTLIINYIFVVLSQSVPLQLH